MLFIWCVTLCTNGLSKEISTTDQSRSDINADQIDKYHFARKIQTPFKDIRRFVWSDDGTLIAAVDQPAASLGAPTNIVVINAKSGAIVANLKLEGAPYGLELAVKFSKTGKYFAAGHSIIRIWRTTDWKMVNTVQGPFVRGQVSQGVSGLDFNYDDTEIYVGYVRLLYPEDLTFSPNYDRPNPDLGIVNDPHNPKRISGEIYNEDTIKGFNIETARQLFTEAVSQSGRREKDYLPIDLFESSSIFYSTKENSIVSFRIDPELMKVDGLGGVKVNAHRNYIDIRSVHNGKIIRSIPQPQIRSINIKAVSKDGSLVASSNSEYSSEIIYESGKDGYVVDAPFETINIFNVHDGANLNKIDVHSVKGNKFFLPYNISMTDNGDYITACSNEGEPFHGKKSQGMTKIWQTRTGYLLSEIVTPITNPTDDYSFDTRCEFQPGTTNVAISNGSSIFIYRMK